jgi:hypothetical protein
MYEDDRRGDKCIVDDERWRGTCILVFIVVRIKVGEKE